MSSAYIPNERLDEELALAIKKALSLDETAPKQKHVRACILYTWDVKGSGSFWVALKNYQQLADEIVIFKALIMVHKVIRQGHPGVLQDAIGQVTWIESLARLAHGYGGRGYHQLIQSYIAFLKAKLQYHAHYPLFLGTFDYEEYVSLRGVDDPNEGYETIHDLLELLDKLDAFTKVVFANLRSYGPNEARIAAFVPLIEESYGIYQFIVSLMTAMHQVIGSVEVLGPLRDKFNRNHYALLKYYDECSGIKYLTSLVSIPKMPREPPNFLSQGPPTKQPKRGGSPGTSEDEAKARANAALLLQQQEEMQRRFLEEEERRLRQQELEQDEQQMRMFEQQQLLQQQYQQQQQLQQMQMQKQMEAQMAQTQLEFFRTQNAQDRQLIEQYQQKMQGLEAQVQQLTFTQASSSSSSSSNEAKLQDEVNQWKQKYDALAKLYAQLRKEHLDLLTKFKSLKDGSSKVADEARAEADKVKAELSAKQAEITELLVERNRLKDETGRVRLQYEEEHAQLNRAHQEEVQVLQTSLDQALLVLGSQQKHSEAGITTRDDEIAKLRNEHRKLLYQMMDNVLHTCVGTVMESVYEFDSTAHQGNPTASPEYVLTLIEKAQQSCQEFSSSFQKLVEGGDPKDAIATSNGFAHCISQLLYNGKGVICKSATDDGESERALKSVRVAAEAAMEFFKQVLSGALAQVPPGKQGDRIVELSKIAHHAVGSSAVFIEGYSKLEGAKIDGGDLGDAIEREMSSAAQAIEAAASKLRDLLVQQESIEGLHVNSAILQSAMVITTAIANLIRCATATQQEIVAHGKGTTSQGAFYKKNNKWTEGLISAAQAVAVSTTYLVEVADGLVKGTHSWEQLVVAAQEVGVATTQLVAASRVKVIPFSKTQDKLEAAANAVREATKLLVKAAKDASKMSAERMAKDEVMKMGKHEAKVKEMEQQVKILELEKALQTARFRLGEIRKGEYRE